MQHIGSLKDFFVRDEIHSKLFDLQLDLVQIAGEQITPLQLKHNGLFRGGDEFYRILENLTSHRVRTLGRVDQQGQHYIADLPPVLNLLVKATRVEKNDVDEIEIGILDFSRRDFHPLFINTSQGPHDEPKVYERVQQSRFRTGPVSPQSNAVDLIITVNRALIMDREEANLRRQATATERQLNQVPLSQFARRHLSPQAAVREQLENGIPWIPAQGQHVLIDGISELCILQDYDALTDTFYCSLADSSRQTRSIQNRGRGLSTPVPLSMEMDEKHGWFAVKEGDIRPRFFYA